MTKKYNILIIGHGHVGSAISNAFISDDITIVDPKFNKNKISDYKKKIFDIIFVCVDTPKNECFQTLSLVLSELNKFLPGNIVCCKSTAAPEYYEKAINKFNKIHLVHSPEYLSHWNNKADFLAQSFLILGGKHKHCKEVAEIFLNRLSFIKTVRLTDIKTAALVKYSENAFLAMKVTFANELFNIHKKLKCPSSFSEFVELLGLDPRINSTHMQVPGRDGYYGWGGHCLEKDTHELEKFSESSLIKFIRTLNKQHRRKA